MREICRWLLFALICISGNGARGSDYTGHDTNYLISLFQLSDSPTGSGKQATINMSALDLILNDLFSHARNYPPQFDTAQGKASAVNDTKVLAFFLDVLTNGSSPNPAILLRAATVNDIGTNLDIPGCAEKTNADFQKLLLITPDDPNANEIYGTFLSSVGKPADAIPHLKKAHAAGIVAASWSLGMVYLSLKDQQQALVYLREYQAKAPRDPATATIIDAIVGGKVQFKQSNGD
jgi:tetratricopeptide (TPR) repeat protein